MKIVAKFTSLLLLTLLTLLTLVIVTGLGLKLLVDPNAYKNTIQEVARNNAQINLNLAGDLSWSVFPLGVSARQITLANTSQPDKPFARLKTLELSVRLLPLLQKKVHIDTIRMDGLHLTLERDAHGRGNWEAAKTANQHTPDLTSTQSRASPPSVASEQAPRVVPEPDSQALTVEADRVILSDTHVDFVDIRDGLRVSAHDMQIDSQGSGLNNRLSAENLRKVDIKLTLHIDRLNINHITLDHVQTHAKFAEGVLEFQSLRAGLAGGNIHANGNLDMHSAQTMLAARATVRDVPLDHVLDYPANNSPIRGVLDINADLHTQGTDQHAWLAGLNGTADVVVKSGVLRDSNLERQVCQGIALLNRKTLGNTPRSKDIPFETLSGSVTLANGVATNPDLRVRIAGFALAGNGTVDIVRRAMDYRLNLRIEGNSSSTRDPACTIHPRYIDLELPLYCRGALESGVKACRLDTQAMAQIASRFLGNRVLENVGSSLDQLIEKNLGEKATPVIRDALRGLFK